MIQVVRGKEDEETVVLYFDSWPKEERCIDLPLKQVSNILFFQDRSVTNHFSGVGKVWLQKQRKAKLPLSTFYINL